MVLFDLASHATCCINLSNPLLKELTLVEFFNEEIVERLLNCQNDTAVNLINKLLSQELIYLVDKGLLDVS